MDDSLPLTHENLDAEFERMRERHPQIKAARDACIKTQAMAEADPDHWDAAVRRELNGNGDDAA